MKQTYPLIGKLGALSDLPPQELPPGAWSNTLNMRFRDGAAERFAGETQIFETPTTTPYYLQSYNLAGKRYWIHAGTNKVFADDGVGARLDITPGTVPTGGVDDRWSGGTLSGVAVLNNGKDVPVGWTGTGVFTAIPGWQSGYRAGVIRPYKAVLVALDITKTGVRYPHMVKWSHAADPGALPASWDQNDLTKLAGEVELAEEPSLMVDCLPLADVNVIYKENSAWGMQPTGGTDVFRFQRLPDINGVLARGCVVATPKGHVVLTNGDLVVHQGGEPKSIINGRMRSWLFRNIDSNNRKRAFLVANYAANEVWVCFPDLGAQACTLALVWSWADDTLAVRQLANATYGATGQLEPGTSGTWAQQTLPWADATTKWNENPYSAAQNRLLLTSTAPRISIADYGATFAGAVFTSVLERTGLAFDTPERTKLLKSCRPRIEGTQGMQVQFEFGGQQDMEGPVKWSSPVTYVVGSTYSVDAFASGRFLALRITSLDNQPYRIRSMDLEYEVLGGW